MKKLENEVVYDGAIEAVDSFAKGYDGIDQTIPTGLQEVWGSELSDKVRNEAQAENVKNEPNS